jgi:hypothetical protein
VRCQFTIVDLIGFNFEDLGSTVFGTILSTRRVISIHDYFFLFVSNANYLVFVYLLYSPFPCI